jgi:putative transposase
MSVNSLKKMSDQQDRENPFGEPTPAPGATAREAVDEMVEAGLLDDLMARVDDGGLRLTGEGGFLPEMIKRVLERGLQAELSDHLGYDKHERTVRSGGGGNARNGSSPKTVRTEVGQVDWTLRGTETAASNPGWCPRAHATSVASMRSSTACARAG